MLLGQWLEASCWSCAHRLPRAAEGVAAGLWVEQGWGGRDLKQAGAGGRRAEEIRPRLAPEWWRPCLGRPCSLCSQSWFTSCFSRVCQPSGTTLWQALAPRPPAQPWPCLLPLLAWPSSPEGLCAASSLHNTVANTVPILFYLFLLKFFFSNY